MRLIVLFLALLPMPGPVCAQAAYDDPITPEGWAWAKIRSDEVADFNQKCDKIPDPQQKTGSAAPCRQISPQFLADVLTEPKLRDQVPQHGVRLRGAHITGTIDLTDAESAPMVGIYASQIEGSVILDDSRWSRPLALQGSTVLGVFSGEGLRSESAIFLNNHATFGGDVNLNDARVGSNLEMDNSTFSKAVNTNRLRVEGRLLMGDHATFGGDVNLAGAKIGSNLEMQRSSFAGRIEASTVNVGGDFFMDLGATFGGYVDLDGAKVGGNLQMEGSSFAESVNAASINIGSNLFAYSTTFEEGISMPGAKIGGMLELGGSIAGIDLSFAEVRDLTLLDSVRWRCFGRGTPASVAGAPTRSNTKAPSACETEISPALNLRNTHVDDFQDSPEAWAPSMDLEGFRYDRLGGVAGTRRDDMRRRSPNEWKDWLARDPNFSTQPYVQLSSVLAAAGHRDTADAILLAGRERERGEDWTQGRYLQWAWLSFLSSAAGYGIGLYTFRVLRWVAGITVLGAFILWFSPNARRQGLLWLLGASLHRLLPIIELSKEFTNFFDNSPPQFDEEPNLNRFQFAYFAGHAIAGWILSLILLAAMSGITQKS
jgi:hypothetical protein